MSAGRRKTEDVRMAICSEGQSDKTPDSWSSFPSRHQQHCNKNTEMGLETQPEVFDVRIVYHPPLQTEQCKTVKIKIYS